jgi:hypothetical protein
MGRKKKGTEKQKMFSYLYEEHKKITGHDIRLVKNKNAHLIECNYCFYLHSKILDHFGESFFKGTK